MRWKPTIVACLTVVVVPVANGQEVLQLPIGDPERRERQVEVRLDAITDSRSGEFLTPSELPRQLEGVRILFVGEQHTSMDFHRVQLRVIQELQRAGRPVMIGLEMYPYTQQQHLERWIGGLLTETGFLELSDWYGNWGYHWEYYRDIFLFARDHRLPMFAVNTPRDVVRSVRERGFEGLSEEEARHVPRQIETENDEHRRLFRAFFEEEEDAFHASMSEEQWDAMFNAQCTWDATMGHNALQALQQHGGPDSILVVLVGQGHVAYDLGIQRQLAQWFEGRTAALIPIPVRDEKGTPVGKVQASYADFVWGLPAAGDELYPRLGLSTTKMDDERRKVIFIEDQSVAEAAGFRIGDVLLSMNGEDLGRLGALNRSLAAMRWGDAARIVVRRDEERVELTAHFRRRPPAGCEEDS